MWSSHMHIGDIKKSLKRSHSIEKQKSRLTAEISTEKLEMRTNEW